MEGWRGVAFGGGIEVKRGEAMGVDIWQSFGRFAHCLRLSFFPSPNGIAAFFSPSTEQEAVRTLFLQRVSSHTYDIMTLCCYCWGFWGGFARSELARAGDESNGRVSSRWGSVDLIDSTAWNA